MELLLDYLGELNWLAVIAAAVASVAVGALWYSSAVAGKKWQKSIGLSNKDIKQANMADVMGTSVVAVLVSATALAVLVKALVLTTLWQGVLFGILVAVGLLGANKLMQVKYELRQMNYWYITLGGDILSYATMGGILAVWQ